MRSVRSNSDRPDGGRLTGKGEGDRWTVRDGLVAAWLCLAVAAFWTHLPVINQAHGDAVAGGQALVAKHCQRCHAAPEAPYSTTAAPTLSQIAQAADWSTIRLEAWLAADHPPMPRFVLTAEEIFMLRSYLSSIKSDALLQPAF